jgi:hypothetical protein
MASTLKVDTIAHTGGTSAITIDSSGVYHNQTQYYQRLVFITAEATLLLQL